MSARLDRPSWGDDELEILRTIYPERGAEYCATLLPGRSAGSVHQAARRRKIKCLARKKIAEIARQRNLRKREDGKRADASRIARLAYRRAHDLEARRIRLDLGSDNLPRITTQRHGAAMLLVLPDTVGIYDNKCAVEQIAADVVAHRTRGAA